MNHDLKTAVPPHQQAERLLRLRTGEQRTQLGRAEIGADVLSTIDPNAELSFNIDI
jgi:hypothetical protein